jgi:hypothetical protein
MKGKTAKVLDDKSLMIAVFLVRVYLGTWDGYVLRKSWVVCRSPG